MRCWIAPRDILPGREWGEAIVEGIAASKVFVLIFSANANKSPQIRREVERAVHRGLLVIPFRIEDVAPERSLEYFMSAPHWLDALTPPLERHLEHLGDVIERFLASGEAEPAPTPSIAVAATATAAASRPGVGRAWMAVPAMLAAAPLLAGALQIDPPWPRGAYIGYLSAALIGLAAASAYLEPDAVPRTRALRWAVPAVLAAGLLIYLSLYSLLVEPVPDGREVKGFACLPDARMVYGESCPALDRDALRDAEWNPAKLWTASSLLFARMALMISWLAVVAALALLAAGRAGREGARREQLEARRR